MEYTEAIIKEAEEVVEKYLHVFPISDMLRTWHSTKCAIQDRQSVLDEAKIAENKCDSRACDYYENRIQSLTKQINYLKSKLCKRT